MFLSLLWLLPRVNHSLREWIFYGGKRTSANPAGVAVHPFGFRLADLVGVPAREESVCLVDYSAGIFSFQNVFLITVTVGTVASKITRNS